MLSQETLKKICFVLVIINACLVITLGLFNVVNQEFKAENDKLQERVSILEDNLYDINLRNYIACHDEVKLNKTCDIPYTIDEVICPQFEECDKMFAEGEKLYRDPAPRKAVEL